MNLDHIAAPNRVMAPFQYYGGKGNLVKKILPLLPNGKVYVEPYCGAASMLFHKQPSGVEVINDLHSEVVNFFRVLQDPETYKDLKRRIIWTPYALDEFKRALRIGEQPELYHPIVQAWAFYVRQNQGFGGIAKTAGNWGRVFTAARDMAMTANSWRSRMKLLRWWHDRLTRVQIEHRDALEVIAYWDSPETVFYLDPPYIADMRAVGHKNEYAEEAADDHHRQLVELLLGLQGQAMLSGYAHPLYAPLVEADWERLDFQTTCHAATKGRGSPLRGKGNALKHVARTETVWLKRRDNTGRLF